MHLSALPLHHSRPMHGLYHSVLPGYDTRTTSWSRAGTLFLVIIRWYMLMVLLLTKAVSLVTSRGIAIKAP